MESQGDIMLALGRLEGKVDALMAQETRTQGSLRALETRVRYLEGSKALLFGICMALGTAASYLVTLYT